MDSCGAICDTFLTAMVLSILCMNRCYFTLADVVGRRPNFIIADSRVAESQTQGRM